MASINTLITKIFKTYGYEILRNAEHMKYILAKKDNVTLSVGYLLSDSRPTKRDIKSFIKTSRNDEAQKNIFISLTELEDDFRSILTSSNVELWDRDDFEREIGRALLSDLPDLGGEGQADFESVVDRVSVTDETESDRHEIMVPFVLGEVPTTISGEKSTEVEDTGLNIMPPRVNRDEAKTITRKIVRSFRFDLQLVPYYIFDFACEIEEGKRKAKKLNRGTLGINSLSNIIEEWPAEYDTVSSLDVEYTKLEPAFSAEEALDRIREAVISLNTLEVESIEDKGTAIIIEKKKIKPKEDVMEISSRGVVYMPVWCVEGSNGVIIVDATSGKIVKEDIFKNKNVSFL
ncbi:MAG: hypothetical protein JSV49_06840 [Thermoplasmata archaeon]|nr:MAG: hypothetical protein JSV49_06840 [Thermoplasmata archaeon]